MLHISEGGDDWPAQVGHLSRTLPGNPVGIAVAAIVHVPLPNGKGFGLHQ